MIGFAIAAGVFLILAILLLIFRLHTLVTVMKQSDQKVGDGLNKTNAVLFMVFLVSALSCFSGTRSRTLICIRYLLPLSMV
jgi:cytochrome c oxidase subunit 2